MDTKLNVDGTVGEVSVGHVIARLAVLEMRVRIAVGLRRESETAHQSPRFRGLYVGDDDVDRLLAANPLAGIRDDSASAQLLANVESAADFAEQRGERLRLRDLARTFGLDQLDVDLLLAAMAPDVDARFERLYAYLHDDVSRRRATIGIAIELAGVSPFSTTGRTRCSTNAPLGAAGLVVVDEPSRPLLSRELRVPDRVVAHLLGSDVIDAALAPVLAPGSAAAPAESLNGVLDSGARLVYLRDREGTADAGGIALALDQLGVPSLAIDLERVIAQPEPAATLRIAAREASLADRILVAGSIDLLVGFDVSALHLLAEAPCRVVLIGRNSWDPRWSWAVPHTMLVAPLARQHTVTSWRDQLDDAERDCVDTETLESLADRYRLGPGQIARAVTAGRAAARARREPLTAAALRTGARAQNAAGLERFAVRVEPSVSWHDLVLPAATTAELRHVAARARHEHAVLGSWGVRPPGRRQRGCIVLFAGESGTGKTMAAEVLAGDLGLDLYIVNLATVVDKYVGETEKNLERILAEAHGVNGVLLFDEADALLGKRSEVKDSRDRYANIEVAYLLQMLDSFEGHLVLTTNLRANLDEAFTRRLDAVVDFPTPEAAERMQLWKLALGTSVPLDSNVDLPFCARSFRLSGGNIRAIAVTAAFLAAENGRPVSMGDVIHATRREYRKLGRLCTASEFGPYLDGDSNDATSSAAPTRANGRARGTPRSGATSDL